MTIVGLGAPLSMAKQRRTLICIPIMHSQGDMGSLGRNLPTDEEYCQLVQIRWAEIQRQVQILALDWSKVKVYQDGLPDAGREIVQKILTEVQSPNYELLRWLVAQGVELIGTESPLLVKEEYDHLQAVITATDPDAKARARRTYIKRAGALLVERDKYIARKVDETLPYGGVGILFIGQAHDVVKYLSSDFEIVNLSPDQSAIMPVGAQEN